MYEIPSVGYRSHTEKNFLLGDPSYKFPDGNGRTTDYIQRRIQQYTMNKKPIIRTFCLHGVVLCSIHGIVFRPRSLVVVLA